MTHKITGSSVFCVMDAAPASSPPTPWIPIKPCQGYGANCLWIITEADHSVTTFLLPEEY